MLLKQQERKLVNRVDDLIKRQDAIDAIIADKIEDGLPFITDTQKRDFEVFNSSCDRHAKILKELPSVAKGHWIIFPPCIEEICMCSNCKTKFKEAYQHRDTCPSCGAMMEVQNE